MISSKKKKKASLLKLRDYIYKLPCYQADSPALTSYMGSFRGGKKTCVYWIKLLEL